MINNVEAKKIQCPYCGEIIEVLIDCSVAEQDYIEDCQVCCNPINFDIRVDENGDPEISVSTEDE